MSNRDLALSLHRVAQEKGDSWVCDIKCRDYQGKTTVEGEGSAKSAQAAVGRARTAFNKDLKVVNKLRSLVAAKATKAERKKKR